MKSKPNDIKMLNVREEMSSLISFNPEVVINEDALRNLYEMVTERQQILKKRLKGEPRPWSENEIFKKYSFTNLRREDDRTSKWLIENISNNPNLDLWERIAQTIVFRLYNKLETAEFFGLGNPIDWNDWDKFVKMYEDNKKSKKISDYYNARVFKMVSIKRMFLKRYNYKLPSQLVIIAFGKELMTKNDYWLKEELLNFFKKVPDSQFTADKLFNVFIRISGIGRFLAYQLFVDMTYINECNLSENEFAVSGPGCDRGLKMLYINAGGFNYDELIFYTRKHLEKLFQTINPKFSCKKLFDNIEDKSERCFNVMLLENVFCEFSKYRNIKTGKYKRGRKYNYKSR